MDNGRMIEAGRIVKSHGLRGGVNVEMDESIAAILNEGTCVSVDCADGLERTLAIERIKQRGHYIFLKFKGIDDRNASDELRNGMISIPMSLIKSGNEDIILSIECVGMNVFGPNGHNIGTVIRVDSYPANDVFVVDTGHSEILIPVVRDFILSIDKTMKRIDSARCDELPEYPKGGV